MKRLFSVAGLAIVIVLAWASTAGAQIVQEYGEGYDCPPDDPGMPCPYPIDPTAEIDPLIALDPLWVGVGETSGGGVGAFVQVGEEDRLGPAVARYSVSVGDEGHLLRVFAEDYTGGDTITSIGETTNEFFGCLSGPNPDCDASEDNRDDASRLTLF